MITQDLAQPDLVEADVLDPEVVRSLGAIPGADGGSLFAEIIELYLGEEPDRLEELARLCERRDAGAVAEWAHAVAGNAAAVGGTAVRRAAAELECAARAAQWSDVLTGRNRLEVASRRLRAELARHAPHRL